MDKKEYIKFLREIQNNYKSECIEINRLFNEKEIDELIDIIDYKIEKSKLLLIIESVILPFLYTNDKTMLITPAVMLLIIRNFLQYLRNNEYKKNTNKDYSVIKECLSNYEKQSDRIENTIEFFNKTSQDDINKYLSYKIK